MIRKQTALQFLATLSAFVLSVDGVKKEGMIVGIPIDFVLPGASHLMLCDRPYLFPSLQTLGKEIVALL